MKKEIKYLPNDFSIDLAFYVYAKKNNYQIVRFPLNFNKKKDILELAAVALLVKRLRQV